MRKLLVVLGVLGLATVAYAYVQKAFCTAYDLSTPPTAATAQALLATTDLLDATVYQSIAGQPDSPRNAVVVIVDTTPSIVAGTVTVAGKDVNGTAQSEALSIAAGAGTYTGTKVFVGPLTFTTASVSVLGGSSDETIAVGSGSVTAFIYCTTSNAGTQTCGYANTDGWHSTDSLRDKLVHIEVGALSATGGVSWQVECKGTGTSPIPKIVLSGSLTTAVVPGIPATTAADTFPIAENCASLRVGLKYGTNDSSGTDSVTAFLVGNTR